MASKLGTLEDLYVDTLKDLYSAEKQLVKALPKMAKSAQSPDLQRAFQEHLGQTDRAHLFQPGRYPAWEEMCWHGRIDRGRR